jgi:hypothetical protein
MNPREKREGDKDEKNDEPFVFFVFFGTDSIIYLPVI